MMAGKACRCVYDRIIEELYYGGSSSTFSCHFFVKFLITKGILYEKCLYPFPPVFKSVFNILSQRQLGIYYTH